VMPHSGWFSGCCTMIASRITCGQAGPPTHGNQAVLYGCCLPKRVCQPMCSSAVLFFSHPQATCCYCPAHGRLQHRMCIYRTLSILLWYLPTRLLDWPTTGQPLYCLSAEGHFLSYRTSETTRRHLSNQIQGELFPVAWAGCYTMRTGLMRGPVAGHKWLSQGAR